MDWEEFRRRGAAAADWAADYHAGLRDRPVRAQTRPGDILGTLPASAPEQAEPLDDILSDIDAKIMPGLTHWQHPNFHAYFPAGNSFPSMLGSLLGDGIGCIGFSWVSRAHKSIKGSHTYPHFRPRPLHWKSSSPSCWIGSPR